MYWDGSKALPAATTGSDCCAPARVRMITRFEVYVIAIATSRLGLSLQNLSSAPIHQVFRDKWYKNISAVQHYSRSIARRTRQWNRTHSRIAKKRWRISGFSRRSKLYHLHFTGISARPSQSDTLQEANGQGQSCQDASCQGSCGSGPTIRKSGEEI